jgi:hypothetical protein
LTLCARILIEERRMSNNPKTLRMNGELIPYLLFLE